jgi:hypothetical protein
LLQRRPELNGIEGVGKRVGAAIAMAFDANEIDRRKNDKPGGQGYLYFDKREGQKIE